MENWNKFNFNLSSSKHTKPKQSTQIAIYKYTSINTDFKEIQRYKYKYIYSINESSILHTTQKTHIHTVQSMQKKKNKWKIKSRKVMKILITKSFVFDLTCFCIWNLEFERAIDANSRNNCNQMHSIQPAKPFTPVRKFWMDFFCPSSLGDQFPLPQSANFLPNEFIQSLVIRLCWNIIQLTFSGDRFFYIKDRKKAKENSNKEKNTFFLIFRFIIYYLICFTNKRMKERQPSAVFVKKM